MRTDLSQEEFLRLSEDEQDAVAQAAFDEVIAELWANGTFGERPCRDCGEVSFFPNPVDEFCVECSREQEWMRAITLAKDQWCPHCGIIRTSDNLSDDTPWREEPACLACGEAGSFLMRADGVLSHRCLHCEGQRVFGFDPFCAVCSTIDSDTLRVLLDILREDEY